jgi:hypothetical protein
VLVGAGAPARRAGRRRALGRRLQPVERLGEALNAAGSRSRAAGKRRTSTPFSRSRPAGSSLRQVT